MSDKIIIYRESFIQSFLSDLSSLVFLIIGFGLNQLFIQSKMMSAILLIIFIGFLVTKASIRKNVFTNKQKAIEFLNN